MSALDLTCLAVPGIAVPILSIFGGILVKAFPPYCVVIKNVSNVCEDGVFLCPWKSCSTRSSLCLSGAGRPSGPSSASLLGALRSEFMGSRWGPVLVASGWGQKGGGAEIQQIPKTTL